MKALVFLLWIFTGVITGVVAVDKGHAFSSWALVGFLLGPIGLIAVAGLSDKKLRSYMNNTTIPVKVKIPTAIEDNQKLFLKSGRDRLLESSYDIKNEVIENLYLDAAASNDEIWEGIIQILKRNCPDEHPLGDRSKSKFNNLTNGEKELIICDSKGSSVAFAYTKGYKDNRFYWEVSIYLK